MQNICADPYGEPEGLINETVLLVQIASGDNDAYRKLYTHYAPKLYRFIYPFAHQSKEETEEVIQEIFLKVWLKRHRLINITSVKAYLFKMAKNHLIDELQKQKVRKEKTDQHSYLAEETTDSVYNKVVYTEYYAMATKAIQDLTPQRKRIFELRTQNEMSIDEIATHLEISHSAVKKQLYEAIGLVKTYLYKNSGWPMLVVLMMKILNRH
ncbi:MAG TPA: sigma-70 family RNA polymerase sigma factor [Pedobacter sp.]